METLLPLIASVITLLALRADGRGSRRGPDVRPGLRSFNRVMSTSSPAWLESPERAMRPRCP